MGVNRMNPPGYLPGSDFISVHVPLKYEGEAEHLISQSFKRCETNRFCGEHTAQGGVIVKALVEALNAGELPAGVDVYGRATVSRTHSNPLRFMNPNRSPPHCAWATTAETAKIHHDTAEEGRWRRK